MTRRQLLVADDSSVTQLILKRLLDGSEYEILEARDGDQAWAMLQGPTAPRLAILDWQMPGLSGVDICRRLRQQEDAPYVYTILVTAREDRASIMTGFDAGADDYLIKPFDCDELKHRLHAGCRVLELQDRLLAVQTRLSHEVDRDGLTELLNRRAILRALDDELNRARRRGDTTGLIMCDLDHFKRVNDEHGHQAGDAVLQGVARVLRETVRSTDRLGRYGGEEFLLILPNTSLTHTAQLAERIRVAVERASYPFGNETLQITFSLGVTSVAASNQLSLESAVRQADVALYQAKNRGRNCVSMAAELLRREYSGEHTASDECHLFPPQKLSAIACGV